MPARETEKVVRRATRIAKLVALLKSNEPWDEETDVKRRNAAIELAKMRDERVIQPLVEALGYPRRSGHDVRLGASEALVMIGSAAIEPLIEALKENSEFGPSWSAGTLREMTGQDFGTDYRKWKKWYRKKMDSQT
jgi:HEAT repeat protein